MPDYDPKNVPTLDDIIEKSVTDKTDIAVEDSFVESDDAVIKAAEYDINQFLAEPISSDTKNSIITTTEPLSYNLNDILEEEPGNIESAPHASVEPIVVELIVKDIVKQLMPDLEQQLTLLLQQALEDKLPDAKIKSAGTDKQN